jgi:penicillin-binding protein 1A
MIKPRVLMRAEDSRGQVVPLNEPARQRVFDFEHVGMLNSILVDVVEKGTGTPAKLEGRMVAGKTGTTDNTVDVWFAGFTHDMAAVAWLGNSRNLPLRGIFSSHAAKVWKAYAEGYYKANPLPAKPVIGALEYRPMTTTKVTVTAPVPPPEAPTDEGAETPQEATPPANTGAPVPAAAR